MSIEFDYQITVGVGYVVCGEHFHVHQKKDVWFCEASCFQSTLCSIIIGP